MSASYAITLLQYHKQETWGYATRETAFTITFISNALKGTFLQFFFTWNAGWEIRCRPAEQLCNVCCACRGALSNQWQQRPIMSSDYVSTWPLQSGQGVLKWEFWPGGEGVSCNLHSPPRKKDINYKPKLSVFIFFSKFTRIPFHSNFFEWTHKLISLL